VKTVVEEAAPDLAVGNQQGNLLLGGGGGKKTTGWVKVGKFASKDGQ